MRHSFRPFPQTISANTRTQKVPKLQKVGFFVPTVQSFIPKISRLLAAKTNGVGVLLANKTNGAGVLLANKTNGAGVY